MQTDEPRPARVLVCEDEPVPRRLLETFLARAGYDVAAAADGEEACQRAEQFLPDVVLLDLMLPKRDGYSVLLHLRGRPSLKDAAILLVSAEPEAQHAAVAATLGAQGFIQKPFDLQHVRAEIERVRRDEGAVR